MFKLFRKSRPKIICYDPNYRTPAERLENLEITVELLQDQIKELQIENVELTNSIYEIANSLESRIDILHESFFYQNREEENNV